MVVRLRFMQATIAEPVIASKAARAAKHG